MNKKPSLYIDIDGVLIDKNGKLSAGAVPFIKHIANNYTVYWLTTHCMHGDPSRAVEYVNRASDEDLEPYLKKFKPTTWSLKKTDAIDMSEPFLWFDDDCLSGERYDLEQAGKMDCWIEIELHKDPYQLAKEHINLLKRVEKQKDAEEFLNRTKLDKSGLVLIAGQTGSGKSTFINEYKDHMKQRYSSKEWGVYAFDIVGYEYAEEDQYLIKRIVDNEEAFQALENLTKLSNKRTKQKRQDQQRVTVHINECDLTNIDQNKFDDSLVILAKNFKDGSGIQVIYETSRVGEQALSRTLLGHADKKIPLKMASLESEEWFGEKL